MFLRIFHKMSVYKPPPISVSTCTSLSVFRRMTITHKNAVVLLSVVKIRKSREQHIVFHLFLEIHSSHNLNNAWRYFNLFISRYVELKRYIMIYEWWHSFRRISFFCQPIDHCSFAASLTCNHMIPNNINILRYPSFDILPLQVFTTPFLIWLNICSSSFSHFNVSL